MTIILCLMKNENYIKILFKWNGEKKAMWQRKNKVSTKKLKRREKNGNNKKGVTKDNKETASKYMFKFSYRNSRLKCWTCSKIFNVNFDLTDHIDQGVSIDFEHFFVLDYLEVIKLWLATE